MTPFIPASVCPGTMQANSYSPGTVGAMNKSHAVLAPTQLHSGFLVPVAHDKVVDQHALVRQLHAHGPTGLDREAIGDELHRVEHRHRDDVVGRRLAGIRAAAVAAAAGDEQPDQQPDRSEPPPASG